MSIASVSSVSSTRQQQAFSFLIKSIPGSTVAFEEVPDSNLQPGDIVLVPFEGISGKFLGKFQHAAIYCGDGEVIHFTNRSSGKNSGWIIKEGFQAMKRERGKCQIYQKKGGINLSEFHDKVKAVMNSEANYDLGENNCIHFALYLLGLAEFYMELVEPQNEGDTSSRGACMAV